MTLLSLTEHHLEFHSLKGGCTGSSESKLVKMPHFWKSHVTAQFSGIKMYNRINCVNMKPVQFCTTITICLIIKDDNENDLAHYISAKVGTNVSIIEDN